VRVMVICEDPGERMRATSALTLVDGIEVVDAASAKEGRKVLREQPAFDVLVVDGDLFPQGGFSFLYEVRAAGELAGEETPPALVMIAREQDRFLTTWSGANDLIIKPVDSFEVLRRVRALTGDTPAQQAPADESGDQVPGEPGAPGDPHAAEMGARAGGAGVSGAP
jgi:DNA-binding response OmpR family regulator